MTVTLNRYEILHRVNGFMRDFADAHYEMGKAQNFIRGLCDVFGFSNKRMVSFEQRVKKLGGKSGRIDGFYPGKLLIEMKSCAQDLDKALHPCHRRPCLGCRPCIAVALSRARRRSAALCRCRLCARRRIGRKR